MDADGNWSDLEKRGFVVLRDAVPDAFLEVARTHARELATRPIVESAEVRKRPGASTVPAPRALVNACAAPVERILDRVRAETNLRPTERVGYVFFFRSATPTTWHTDHPPYYQFGQARTSIQFWIPVDKPDRSRTGVAFLPWDVLYERDRPLHDALAKGGAFWLAPSRVVSKGEDLYAEWLASDEPTQLPLSEYDAFAFEAEGRLQYVIPKGNLDELAVAPPVSPGDVVLFRGDTLHTTQDTETVRTAIALRTIDGDARITPSTLREMSKFTRERALAIPNDFVTKIYAAFAFAKKNELSARELLAFLRAVEAKQPAEQEIVRTTAPRIREILNLAPA